MGAGCPSNRYHLIDNDEQFQVTMDVPGVNEENIDTKLDDGQLTVEGQRTVGSESSRFSSKFFRSFTLDASVDVDNFTATLKSGVLTISAPKDLSKLEENVRRIPITPAEEIEDVDCKDDTTSSAKKKKWSLKPSDTKHDTPKDSNVD